MKQETDGVFFTCVMAFWTILALLVFFCHKKKYDDGLEETRRASYELMQAADSWRKVASSSLDVLVIDETKCSKHETLAMNNDWFRAKFQEMDKEFLDTYPDSIAPFEVEYCINMTEILVDMFYMHIISDVTEKSVRSDKFIDYLGNLQRRERAYDEALKNYYEQANAFNKVLERNIFYMLTKPRGEFMKFLDVHFPTKEGKKLSDIVSKFNKQFQLLYYLPLR